MNTEPLWQIVDTHEGVCALVCVEYNISGKLLKLDFILAMTSYTPDSAELWAPDAPPPQQQQKVRM